MHSYLRATKPGEFFETVALAELTAVQVPPLVRLMQLNKIPCLLLEILVLCMTAMRCGATIFQTISEL
jgi:hypothetical protein